MRRKGGAGQGSVQPPKKGLIISSGDASDYDGFMSLPLYYVAAKKNNMDVAFVMNYPAYMDASIPVEYKDRDKFIEAYYQHENSLMQTGPALEIEKNTLEDSLSKEKVSENPEENKIKELMARITEIDKELTELQNHKNNHGRQDLGSGYMYSYETFNLMRNHRDFSANKKGERYMEVSLNAIDTEIFSITTPTFIDNNNRILISGTSNVSKNNLYRDKMMLTFITKYIIDKIWSWCDDMFANVAGDKPELKFCIGGTNKFNPFSAGSVKDEIKVYGDVVYKSIMGNFQNEFAITRAYSETMSISKLLKLNTILNNYGQLYIDMNGSAAWYESDIRNMHGFQDRVQGVFVMGGVLDYSQVNTLGANPFLNRLSCATMNQLYDGEKTAQFFTDFADKLVFVTNNEINANFSFVGDAKSKEKDIQMYEDFKKRMKECCLIDNNDTHFTVQAFDAYYSTRANDRKPFDVITSLALVAAIEKQLPLEGTTHKLLFDTKYGITILSKSENELVTQQDILTNYVKNGYCCGKIPSGMETNPFFRDLVLEKNNLLKHSLSKEGTLSLLQQGTQNLNPKDTVTPKFLDTLINVNTIFVPSQANYVTAITNYLSDKFELPPLTLLPKLANIKQSAGGKHSAKLKKTSEKVLLGNRERSVYIGHKNAKFVMVKGEYIALKTARVQYKNNKKK